MKKRIKPGYDVTLPNGQRVFERAGHLVHFQPSASVGDIDVKHAEALAAALSDAVEYAPMELWEVAREAIESRVLGPDDPRVNAEPCDWQAVVDAVLVAPHKELAERSVVMFAIQRADGLYWSKIGFTEELKMAKLFRYDADASNELREVANEGSVVPVSLVPTHRVPQAL